MGLGDFRQTCKIPWLLFLVILSAMRYVHKPANRRSLWSRINLEKKEEWPARILEPKNTRWQLRLALHFQQSFLSLLALGFVALLWSDFSEDVSEVWVDIEGAVGTVRLEEPEDPVDTRDGSDESLPVTAGFSLKIGKSSWVILFYGKGKTEKNRLRHF